MKTMMKMISAGAVMALAMGSQNAMAENATTTATIINPISITKKTDFAFGTITITDPTALATAVISTNTSAVTTVAYVNADGAGTQTAAKFTVAGGTGNTYTVSLPASVELTGAGTAATQTMLVDTLTVLDAAGASIAAAGAGSLVAGTQDIYVGGKLNIKVNQANGSYSGTLGVTVAYN